jgi:hypothetical protein
MGPLVTARPTVAQIDRLLQQRVSAKKRIAEQIVALLQDELRVEEETDALLEMRALAGRGWLR